MRNREEANDFIGGPFAYTATLHRSPHWQKTGNAFKVRKGLVGDYVNVLEPETVMYIRKRIVQSMPEVYGYDGSW